MAVKKATTGVYLDTGFTGGIYIGGLAMKDSSIKLLTDNPERSYGIDVPKVTVSGNQGPVGTASFEGDGMAYSLVDGENGAVIPDLSVHVKVSLVNQDLTLNVTETTLKDGQEHKQLIPEVKASVAYGNPVRYI